MPYPAVNKGFVMDDFISNLFGFPPGSRMFVSNELAFAKAIQDPKSTIIKREDELNRQPNGSLRSGHQLNFFLLANC